MLIFYMFSQEGLKTFIHVSNLKDDEVIKLFLAFLRHPHMESCEFCNVNYIESYGNFDEEYYGN